MSTAKPNSLEARLQQYASPVEMLRHSTVAGIQFPIKPEHSNWRDEQEAWQNSVILFDQSHHM
jgi:vanillate/3-O-methylgallate O-demethylase